MKMKKSKKPNKKLFEYHTTSNYVDREYEFTNLEGNIETYYLSSEEKLLERKCLLCDCHLVNGYSYMDKWTNCPSCGFPITSIDNVKEYKETLEKQLNKYEEELSRINEIKTKIKIKIRALEALPRKAKLERVLKNNK